MRGSRVDRCGFADTPSHDFSQRSARCDGDLRAFMQRFQFPPQVFSLGVLGDLDGEKASRLERAPESFGEIGHLLRVADRLVAIEQMLVASPKPFDLGGPASNA